MRFLKKAYLFPALTLLAACSGDPTGVGIGVLPPTDSLHVASVQSASNSDQTFLSRVGGSTSILLAGNTENLSARAIIGFTALASIPSVVIDSAVIKLRIGYRFLDSTGTLGFEVHRMLNGYPAGTVLWDSTTKAGVYSDSVAGTFLQNVSPADTTISVRLDTTLLSDWRSAGSGAVILIPGGTVIAGFTNTLTALADLRPELIVSYHDSVPETFTRFATAGVFVADGVIPAIPDRIVLQAGIAQKGIIHFDSLAIPPKATITQAFLEVALDTAQSLVNGYSLRQVDAFLEGRQAAPYDSLLAYGTAMPATVVNGQTWFRANVKSIVQQWYLKQTNFGIAVRASGEKTTLDRFTLYGSTAPAALRPVLKITYTILP